jgi:L-histidine N-alpha-methyltransferase
LSGLTNMTDAQLTIDIHLDPDDADRALRADVERGLTSSPKWLPPKWFYDDRGSQLFDAITRLDEYYPTRCERAILIERASDIAELTRADTLVELGSGTSEKTRLLLDAFAATGRLRRFVPFDVSEQTLRAAAAAVHSEYPGTAVHAVVGDFERHLHLLPRDGRRCIAFLGGTIGNLFPADRARFFADVRNGLGNHDTLLLGVDLVKDPDRLERAYDDERGVTAEFNRNVLRVINRELDADFPLDAFVHVARFDPATEWIEMHLEAVTDLSVKIRGVDLVIDFVAGERLRTEISAKFRPDGIRSELAAAGLTVARFWTDPAGDFGLVLARPA